jgi:ACS family hexuronate transporter-like MFS transporter
VPWVVRQWGWPAAFVCTGAIGFVWLLAWLPLYHAPERHARVSAAELAYIRSDPPEPAGRVPWLRLLRHRQTWAVVVGKAMTDPAWYFYLFWLPKFLFDAFHLDIKTAGSVGWIPYAASGVGCLCGGALSSALLRRGWSVNAARKVALGASAALMPWVMLVPRLHAVGWVIFVFSLAFFGQQSWSTLVMILPTDMIPRRAVGTLAGLVGFGGAMGGVLLGQVVGWMRDHGWSYTPALVIAGSLHVVAFAVLCLAVPTIRPLPLSAPRRQPA